jgi:hypothetical protein
MQSTSANINDAIKILIEDQIKLMSTKSFAELSELPSQSSEDVILLGKKITLSIWHDVLESKEHRVVIQAYKRWLFGMGRMYAQGFIFNSLNQKRELNFEELSPFT